MAWLGLGLILLATLPTDAAPEPEPEPTGKPPATVDAKAAVDPAKLAGSAALQATDATNRVTSAKNLEKLAAGVHDFAADANFIFAPDVEGKGKQLLSWRVRLLPYLGEKALFDKFKLDQPWDGKHNLALLDKMPEVFESPRVTVKRKGYTVYQVFSGPGALYEAGKTRYKLGNVPDGTSHTILIVESSKAVPWTKPADLPYDKAKPIPDFGKAFGGKPLCAMADGSSRVLDLKKITTDTLRNAICPDDGNALGADW
jgi:hypothetical protein